MQSGSKASHEIVCSDLDPDFVEDLGIGVGWAYQTLFESISCEPGLPADYRLEAFAQRRGREVALAIKRAADKHRVPYEFVRLDSNGQRKLLVKAGRVIIFQEPILTLHDEPKIADFKVALADAHGLVRQLELDLGDIVRRVADWSGCVLGVLLHGACGPNFSESHRKLGALMLGVPDAAYTQWVHRLDLHGLAMFGRGSIDAPTTSAPHQEADLDQPDNVDVTSKRKNARKGVQR